MKKVEENSATFLALAFGTPMKKPWLQLAQPMNATVPRWMRARYFDRLAGTWTYWGWKGKYFDSEADALAFRDELAYMLATQRVAPNSPQWFNTGLHWAYGIDGPGQGHYYVDPDTGKLTKSKSFLSNIRSRMPASSSPLPTIWSTMAASWTCGCVKHACSNTVPAPVRTSLICAAKAKNSPVAAVPPGLMSFLKIGDRAAGAIKSGGTTRRAAKMVVVDVDHPDIEEYIDWKVKEEQKVAALVTGSKIVKQHLAAIMKACVNCEADNGDCYRADQKSGTEARDQGGEEESGPGKLYPARYPVRQAGLHGYRLQDL